MSNYYLIHKPAVTHMQHGTVPLTAKIYSLRKQILSGDGLSPSCLAWWASRDRFTVFGLTTHPYLLTQHENNPRRRDNKTNIMVKNTGQYGTLPLP